MKKIAIIGAGASGLVAAIAAAQKGVVVKVYEKNNKIGKKLLATGNGRCNMTNSDINLSRFHGKNVSFAKSALQRFNFQKCLDFFSGIGIEATEGEKGRVFPMSLQASSVVDMLAYEAKRLGVLFELSSKVSLIQKTDNGFAVRVLDKTEYFEKVLIAAGGAARPTLGGSESGYDFALNFSHTVIKPRASLVQLVCDESVLKRVAGVKINAHIKLFSNKQTAQEAFGDVLFTDYGLSGSAILDISRKAGSCLDKKEDVWIVIDLLPDFTKESLRSLLQRRLKFANDKDISLWLEGIINKKLTFLVLDVANLNKNIHYAKDLTIKDLTKISYAVKNIKTRVIDTKGFKNAEVTAGGVSVDEINPSTMESKLQKGLHFSGEVLDIDGDCGGYNLHWAWASGFVAGCEMAR